MVNRLVEKKQTVSDTERAERPAPSEHGAGALKNFYEKIRSVKNVKIIAALLVAAVALLVFAALYNGKTNTAVSAKDPLRDLEVRLSGMLSEIKGAGKVSVMIMYDGGVEYVTANSSSVTTNKTTDNSGGVDRITENTTETSTPIIINENGQSKPIIIKEIMPNITGVMIIAEGANDVSVRMELMRAAATILDVNSNIIEVFTRKK